MRYDLKFKESNIIRHRARKVSEHSAAYRSGLRETAAETKHFEESPDTTASVGWVFRTYLDVNLGKPACGMTFWQRWSIRRSEKNICEWLVSEASCGP